MREFKFRVWDKIVGIMHEPNEKFWTIIEPANVDLKLGISLSNFCYRNCLDYDLEIMQFTGLKDNTGREIYEGDILEINYSAGHERDSSYDIHGSFQVIFKNGEWKAIGENLWGDKDQEYSVWVETTDYAKKRGTTVEIIGNIYENPELIK